MRRAKMHWVIKTELEFIRFELNGELNCLIPQCNDKEIRNRYFQILSTASGNNFSCIII